MSQDEVVVDQVESTESVTVPVEEVQSVEQTESKDNQSAVADMSKIRKQMEFYFSDSNLPRDKFLLAKTQESSERWVDIALIASFSRMRAICPDVPTIAAAIAESTVIEMNEDHTKVRRVAAELPESADLIARCVHAQGFPQNATLDSIQEFLDAQGIKFNSVRLIKNKAREFTGAAFIELPTVEDVSKTAEMDLEFETTKLTLCSRRDFYERQNAERTGKADRTASAIASVKGHVILVSGIPQDAPHQAIKAALESRVAVDKCKFSYVQRDSATPTTIYIRLSDPVVKNEHGDVVKSFNENLATEVVAQLSEAGNKLTIGEQECEVEFMAATEEQESTFGKDMEESRKAAGNKPSFRGGRRNDGKRARHN